MALPSLTAKPVRLAVVGLGQWGPNLLRTLTNDPRCDVAYVVDRDPNRLALVAHRYPNAQLDTSIMHPLDDPTVRAFVIATPATTHYDIGRRALQAGKDCLIEKPFTTNLVQAEELAALARDRELVLAVGHVFLYNAAVREVKSYVDSGALGELRYVSMVRTNLGPPGMDVDVLWDLLAHDVSIANYWLGTKAREVAAHGGSWITRGKTDTVFATLRYPLGQLVHMVASWLNPRKARDIVAVGSRLMVTLDDLNSAEPLRIYDKGIDAVAAPVFADTFGEFRASVRHGDVRIPRIVMGEPLQAECADFVTSVLTREPPHSSGETALSVVETVEALHRSLQHGGILTTLAADP